MTGRWQPLPLERDDVASYVYFGRDGSVSYLIVEQLPSGGWNWRVLDQNGNPLTPRVGTAATVHEALQAAECVV